ncbi:TetR/AcrR family transcriptional regulator [Galactobacter sp.]|uniref:TetR/AcrR family transcriptional regulator n=1 Tax=Galactobacter sp. TaxID=2676125 RepID=UPI0025BA5387|nr:TetR family transcriptional regulator [Galactobacter sp.]
MSTPTFQRARSEDQRQQRREKILEVTANMLSEMSVADISLNELSRRVGLAKSNVLRYFESREDILLNLLNSELETWAAEVTDSVHPSETGPRERITGVASALASALAQHSVLCDLISAQAAVLERNISTAVALQHKQDIGVHVTSVVTSIRSAVPELSEDQAAQVMTHFIIAAAGAWPQVHPSEALQAVYDEHPEIAAGQVDFEQFLRDTVEFAMGGLLSRTH